MSSDVDESWNGWSYFEYVFTAFFVWEMVFKMRCTSVRDYFTGNSCYWNWFDFVIVSLALIDSFLDVLFKLKVIAGAEFDLSQLVVIKMARLARLARLIKLLRFRIFNELKMMVEGVLAGLRVLFWAIVLFFAVIYLMAMFVRKTIGKDEEIEGVYANSLSSVPWAMFTLFRCFTDGCAANDGTPLQVHLFERYGAIFMVTYMLIFLFITIGLFNLIMAIFVDNVMQQTNQTKQRELGRDPHNLQDKLRKLVKFLYTNPPKTKEDGLLQGVKEVPSVSDSCRSCFRQMFDGPSSLWSQFPAKDSANETVNFTIVRDVFFKWLEVPELLSLLEMMDITTSNPYELFDILDADMSGELDCEELVSGLMALRGSAQKSDSVASLLSIRVVLEKLIAFRAETEANIGKMHDLQVRTFEILVDMCSKLNHLS